MDEQNSSGSNIEDLTNRAAVFQKLSNAEKLEFLDDIVRQKDENAGAFLNLVYTMESDKNVRKHIRTLLHKLKTVGIKTEEPATDGEPVLKKIEEKREHRGYLSNYDDLNTRVVLSFFEAKKNNFIFINGIAHLTDGLVDLITMPVDKRELDEIMYKYKHDTGESMAVADISFRYAGYILEEESRKSGKYVEDISQMRKFTSNIKDLVQRPEDIYNLECPASTTPTDLENILEHRIFEPFKFVWSSMEEDRKDYNGSGSAALVLPPYMIEEKKEALLKSLFEKDDLKSVVTNMKRILEDYAYIFYSIEEYPYFKGLIDCLEDSKTPLRAALYFLKKSLEEEPEEKDEEGIILNPYG